MPIENVGAHVARDKVREVQAITARDIPGILLNPGETAISFNAQSLPASDHFFFASDLVVTSHAGQLHVVFGQRPSISASKEFRLAIEIIFPLFNAVDFLYDNVWSKPGLNGAGLFIDSIRQSASLSNMFEDEAVKEPSQLADEEWTLPKDPNCFRMFPSNFAAVTISAGQSMIEFFEGSPDLMVSLTHQRSIRPNEGVKSVVSVILPPLLLLKFFETTRPILERCKGIRERIESEKRR